MIRREDGSGLLKMVVVKKREKIVTLILRIWHTIYISLNINQACNDRLKNIFINNSFILCILQNNNY